MGPAKNSRPSHLGGLALAAFERASLAELQRRVLDAALASAGLSTMPEQLEQLTFFVSGPLYEHAQRTLGSDYADALLVEMSPVLDHAWDEDRAALDVSMAERHRARPPAQPSPHQPPASLVRSRSAIQRLSSEMPCSFEPTSDSAPPKVSREPSDTDRAPDTEPAPSSRRNTMPYLESVLASDRACRILVVHQNETRRHTLALALEQAGHSVVSAHDARVAAMLTARIGAAVVVADVETIAPDFEPLGAAFESLFGDRPSVPVVLLSDGQRPDLPPFVRNILSEASAPHEVLAAVEEIRALA